MSLFYMNFIVNNNLDLFLLPKGQIPDSWRIMVSPYFPLGPSASGVAIILHDCWRMIVALLLDSGTEASIFGLGKSGR